MTDLPASAIAAIKMITDQLTDEELNAIVMMGLMDGDPRGIIGYEKAKMLFQSNGKMAGYTKDELCRIHEERFPQQVSRFQTELKKGGF